MPRIYKRQAGARCYRNYSDETLAKALNEIRKGNLSINKASKTFSISAATISRKLREKHMGSVGRPTTLSDDDEQCLAQCLILSSEWGFPLTQYDVRIIVKGFLDRRGVVEKRFKSNMPGIDWVRQFLNRNKNVLSERLCQNIKRARAAVGREEIQTYFDELKISLEGVSPEVILNYDETNMTDDPEKKKS